MMRRRIYDIYINGSVGESYEESYNNPFISFSSCLFWCVLYAVSVYVLLYLAQEFLGLPYLHLAPSLLFVLLMSMAEVSWYNFISFYFYSRPCSCWLHTLLILYPSLIWWICIILFLHWLPTDSNTIKISMIHWFVFMGQRVEYLPIRYWDCEHG